MALNLPHHEDTIVAPATAPGVSAIAVIRLSGSKAFTIIDELFPAKKISAQASHTLHVGMLKRNEEEIDEAVISIFRAPKSFTGEDVIEISCHGSMFVQEQIINACISEGARPAKAGEFTQRAFLNGKMDLAQAEAVADIIASDSAAAQKNALQNMKGGFSHALSALRDQLLGFAALIDLELDFSEEDVEFADRTKFHKLLGELTLAVNRLVESFVLGNVIRNGVRVAIVGAPNAGKSTLLNALLNEERAIVSDVPGTTRDTIEETLNINGVIYRLVDTAGIRDHSGDTIEAEGIERSLQNIQHADLILHVIDTAHPAENFLIQEELAEVTVPVIEVMNKSDLNQAGVSIQLSEALQTGKSAQHQNRRIPISAREKYNIDLLKDMMHTLTINEKNTEGAIVTNIRHLESLQQVARSLTEIKEGLDAGLPVDLLTPDIQTALHHLGEITGEVTTEEKLGWIFGKFCIGK